MPIPEAKESDNTQKLPEAAIVADAKQKDENLFAFTCTSNLSDVAQSQTCPEIDLTMHI